MNFSKARRLWARSPCRGGPGAQAYPGRPVHILVGLAAGGPTDVAARVIAEWLSQQFGQQFIVENRSQALAA